MKLKKLEITGFKSFVERSAIRFPEGVSAVVGPNGCGKSNILDALVWVMGEQRPKNLRGKSMSDVIFSGSRQKAPLNMAEVSLTLLNDNGSGPSTFSEFPEIMITRRLYRDGAGAYFINRRPCRLKDIHNVFLGSGLSSRSYAVIQQGNIGEITEAGPERRREFIEEIAGVRLYKQRRREALAKVRETRRNISRVNDILAEIKSAMDALNRQAGKARRYQKQRDRLRRLDILISIHDHGRLLEKFRKNRAALKALTDRGVACDAELASAQAALEEIRLLETEKSAGISDLKAGRFETQRAIDQTEYDLKRFRTDSERIKKRVADMEKDRAQMGEKAREMESDISRLQKERRRAREGQKEIVAELDAEKALLEDCRRRMSFLDHDLERRKSEMMELAAKEARIKNICRNAEKNREEIRRRIEKTATEKKQAERDIHLLGERAAEADAALESAKRREKEAAGEADRLKKRRESMERDLSGREEKLRGLEGARQKTGSRYLALKKMNDDFQWCKDGVKAIMKAGGPRAPGDGPGRDPQAPEVIALMADVIEPEPSFEAACEAALGELLQYVIVKDARSGALAMDYLKAGQAGRSGFIPLSSLRAPDGPGAGGEGREARLLDHVSARPGFEKLAEAFLGHVAVAEDIHDAAEIHRARGCGVAAKTGDWIGPSGIMTGGGAESASGVLERKNHLKKMAAAIERMDEGLKERRRALEESRDRVKEIRNAARDMAGTRERLERQKLETEKESYRLSEDFRHARRHCEVIALEHERLLGEEKEIRDEADQNAGEARRISARLKEAGASADEMSGEAGLLDSEISEYEGRVMELKLERAALKSGFENAEKTLARLEAFKSEEEKRMARVVVEIRTRKERRVELGQKREAAEKELAREYRRMAGMDQDLEERRAGLLELRESQSRREKLISDLRLKRENQLREAGEMELEDSRLKGSMEAIEERILDSYGASLEELGRSGDFGGGLERDVEKTRLELASLKKRMARAEDVNLGAIKEYERHRERHEFMSGQRDDLMSALENLNRVISKINAATKKRFMETFDLVNEKLGVVFPRLFEGGSAALSLTDPDDPLETGVEFMAQPPGKKLARMSLLSGGEKALAGIAFVFSIYLIKPASFCLMDEIDAPLDEANTFRFNELLKIIGEKSQIVMITHNKKSMEFAESLFGVTMEKKGVSKIVSVRL
ncbi:Chromosome partition protein Smc [Candidatus Desulfarcum epimagneticum]|uniref:Chromosome partition protein Smc n=1 Tax=uncultured Desulfobacteraceae bacterium TaxID=218296 RepID=A0A484HGV7_9BACT|nr:Chromosome partition protein Smc [uncultured Desulfobacteraceae bacterium]